MLEINVKTWPRKHLPKICNFLDVNWPRLCQKNSTYCQRQLWNQGVFLRALSSPPPRISANAGPGRLVFSQQKTFQKDTASLAWGHDSGEVSSTAGCDRVPLLLHSECRVDHTGEMPALLLCEDYTQHKSPIPNHKDPDCCPRGCFWWKAFGGSLVFPASFSKPQSVCCPVML